MSMIVQHNITAMNSNRMLGVTTSAQAKSTEKLSSGYKINRAADDAAGLSISEKMRKQIRGLTQATANAQDGISAVQTAEGALAEVQDMLQRMNELAVKSANGTNSVSDRQAIQDEINQLTTEIDRVAETTKFNETYLLKGDADAEKKVSMTYGDRDLAKADLSTGKTTTGSNTGSQITITTSDPKTAAEAAAQNELLHVLQKSGATLTTAAGSDTAAIAVAGYDIDSKGNVSKDGIATGIKLEASTGTDNSDGKTPLTDTVTLASDDVTAEAADGKAIFYDADGNKISENALTKYFTTNDDKSKASMKLDAKLYDQFRNEIKPDKFDDKELTVNENLIGDLKLKLHVGADATANNQISVNVQAMSAKNLGVNGLKVDGATDKNALNAIETIKEALSKVSTQRSELGAVQNRLEHTIKNLDNVVENTTSAESAIRDTDMATEMVTYSKNNILAQAGQSMLAQANQSNQGVLSLLG